MMEEDEVTPTLATPPDDDQLSDESPLLPAASLDVKKASMRWMTVEPIIILGSIAFGILITVQPQYIKQRLADGRNFSLSGDESAENGSCNTQNTSDPDYIIEQEIQADTSYWLLVITISGYFPALFTSPFIGAWSDKAGRKIALGLPILGYVITAITYLLVYYFVLPLWVIAIGYFLQGITGSYGLLLAGCYAYIADVTTKEKRMIRIVVIQGAFVLGVGLSQILVGFLIAALGFGPTFWLAVLSLLGSLVYIKVPPFLIETIQPRDVAVLEKSKIESVYQLFHTNTDSRRVKLILLLIIAFFTEIFSQASLNVTLVYGLGPPFCWSSVIVGWYSAVLLFVSAGAMVGGTKGFALCLTDDWILQVGMVFGVINGLFNAFATTTLELFLAAALTCIRSVEQPMFHLMLSKLVNADEQGVMFACESSVLNLSSFFSPVFLNTIYAATVNTQPNLVFFTMAVGRILVIVIIGILQVVLRYRPTRNATVPSTTTLEKVEKESKEC